MEFIIGRKIDLLFIFLTLVLLVLYIRRAKKGKIPSLKEIEGIKAIDEAVARAIELGKIVHYTPGTGAFVGWTSGGMSPSQTLAGLNILSYVARQTARLNAPLVVSTCYPEVYNVAKELVKDVYTAEGCLEHLKTDAIRFFPIATSHGPYVSGVMGILERENVGANIMCGAFYYEAIVISEAGYGAGAFQIAGSSSGLPYFIATCDYVIIGEEIYAASAKLSEDPVLIGSIAGQDICKLIIFGLIILGVLLTTMGVDFARLLA